MGNVLFWLVNNFFFVLFHFLFQHEMTKFLVLRPTKMCAGQKSKIRRFPEQITFLAISLQF